MRKKTKAQTKKRKAPIIEIDVTPLTRPTYEFVTLQGEVWENGKDDESYYTNTELTLARPARPGDRAYLRLRGDEAIKNVFLDEVKSVSYVQMDENEIDALIAMLQTAKKYFAGGKLKATRDEDDE